MVMRTFPTSWTLLALISLLLIALLTGQFGKSPRRRDESLLRTIPTERRILAEKDLNDPRTVEQKIPGINNEPPAAAADDGGNTGRRITICGRMTGPLPGMIKPGPEPIEDNFYLTLEETFKQYVSAFAEKANVKPSHGILLLDNRGYGQTGNMMRELFHGLDIARYYDLIPVIYDNEFPINHDLLKLFPFLDHDEIRRIFGVKIVGDSGLDLDLQAIDGVEAYDLLNFGGRILSLRQEIFPESEINRIIMNRRHIIQQMFELMEARADLNEETRAACNSMQSASIGQDTRYTVIHSRSFRLRGKEVSDHVLGSMGVDTTGPVELPAHMIAAILTPLNMDSEPLFMITDGNDMAHSNRLSSHPYWGRHFSLAPGGDVFADLILAVMSDVFIGNPMSTFSTLIAQIRYALGFRFTYLHPRVVDGKWETFCEDEECFYNLHNV